MENLPVTWIATNIVLSSYNLGFFPDPLSFRFFTPQQSFHPTTLYGVTQSEKNTATGYKNTEKAMYSPLIPSINCISFEKQER